MKNDLGWRVLWEMLYEQRCRLICSLLFTVLATAAELLPYWIIFQAIDLLFRSPESIDIQLYSLAGWLLIVLLAKSLLYAIAYYFSHQAAFHILTDTRKKLVSLLAYAPLQWLQQRASGKLKHTLLQDVEHIENFVAHHTVEVLSAVIGPILVTVFLFCIDWHLALAALVIAPVAVLSSVLFMSGLSKEYLEFNEAEAKLDSTTVEYLRNMPVMKLFRQDANSFNIMRQRLRHYYDLVAKLTKKTVPGWSLFSSLLGASVLVILPVGIWLYDNDIATVMQVVMAVTLGAGMLKPLLKVSRFFMEINEVLASVRQISTILTLPEDNSSGQYLEHEKPIVKFCHVDFSYEQQLLLKRVNLTLLPSSFTVLLGPSGAGKTTIAKMLAGLLVPDQGNVTIGGKLVSELASEERCRLIAVATQEAFLFKGTIRENLVLARHSASDEEIDQALKVAQADDLIASLPEGLDTLIQEQGIRLSGGEKQRIAIARAFLADTPVVVLDEAAASLDNLTQQAFYQDIKTYYPDKTFLVIAHRSYGVETADQIIVLEAGCITGVGNHQELIENSVFYKQLWACQTENEQWALLASENNKNSIFIEELTNV